MLVQEVFSWLKVFMEYAHNYILRHLVILHRFRINLLFGYFRPELDKAEFERCPDSHRHRWRRHPCCHSAGCQKRKKSQMNRRSSIDRRLPFRWICSATFGIFSSEELIDKADAVSWMAKRICAAVLQPCFLCCWLSMRMRTTDDGVCTTMTIYASSAAIRRLRAGLGLELMHTPTSHRGPLVKKFR